MTDKGQLFKIKQQLKDKNITLASIAREYGCSDQFVNLVFGGKATSQPFIDFCLNKLKTA